MPMTFAAMENERTVTVMRLIDADVALRSLPDDLPYKGLSLIHI